MNSPAPIGDATMTEAIRQDALDPPEFISLQDLVAVARRNLFTLVGLPTALALLGLYAGLAQDPLFRATAMVQLDPKPTQPLRGTEIYDPGYDSGAYYNTQLRIIRSRKLAGRLVDRLGLKEVEEFSGGEVQRPALLEQVMSVIPGMPLPPPPAPRDPEDIREQTLRRVMDAVGADLAPGTTLIQIHFISTDRELAADAANALSDIYIEELLQARLDVYAKATHWISDKLGDVGLDLSAAEGDLQAYRESKDLVNVGGLRSLVESELEENSRRLREAQRSRVQLENQYDEIGSLTADLAGWSEAQSLLLDPVVKQAAETFVEAKSQVRTLESRYGSRHPQFLAAQAKLEEAERNYRNQLKIKARGLASELEIARRNESQLRAAVAASRKRLQELDRDEFQINMLERRVRSNRQLYDVFLTRFNETESNSTFNEVNARIADPAVPPNRPFAPDKGKMVTLAAALGVFFAVVIVLLRQLLHTRFEIPEEIEALTSMPLIGIVPECKDRLLKASAAEYFKSQPRAAFCDAVRSIKTAIVMTTRSISTSRGEGFVIAMSSAEPAEGKTTLCVALATALASNAKVLLIDADLRRPTLARHFGRHSSDATGLTDLLLSDLDAAGVLQKDSNSNMDIITAGHPTPNPAMLLESKRFGDLISHARTQYDFVLIDTPPILAASDALHLTKNVDGHVLVVRAEQTHKRAFAGMLKRLESVNAKGLGVIMNGAVMKRSTYTGYYYYGSTYQY